ncbi:hypothetical protein CDCA_CDCA10G2961 [Cyanidium caldarium]|uniref:Condensin complex subunit 1 C-terminal domain-containing protein n=1 Tax=Cyanidium caldarium TaxID=2771 RepID=A0AAV9IXX5_CYACA|nr:hypothetical protein CDCA_CDCA10G2961 [Cyanidium caldarium]
MTETTQSETLLAFRAVGACFYGESRAKHCRLRPEDVFIRQDATRFLQHWRETLIERTPGTDGQSALQTLADGWGTVATSGALGGGKMPALRLATLRVQLNAETRRAPRHANWASAAHELLKHGEWKVALASLCWLLHCLNDLWLSNRPPGEDDVEATDTIRTVDQFRRMVLRESELDAESITAALYAWMRLATAADRYRRAREHARRVRRRAVADPGTVDEGNEWSDAKSPMSSGRGTPESVDDSEASNRESSEDGNNADDGADATPCLGVADWAPCAATAYLCLLRLIPSAFLHFAFRHACRIVQGMLVVAVDGDSSVSVTSRATLQGALQAAARLFETRAWVDRLVELYHEVPDTERSDGSDLPQLDSLRDALGVAAEMAAAYLNATFDPQHPSVHGSAEVRATASRTLRLLLCTAAAFGERTVHAVARALLPLLLGAPDARRPPSRLLCHFVVAVLQEAAADADAELGEVCAQRIHASTLLLTQHLGVRAPDRADRREAAATSILALFGTLPPALAYRFCDWLVRLSCHPRATVRLLAMEIGRNIEEEPDDDPHKTPHDLHVAWQLFERLFLHRTNDRVAAVRAKALAAAAEGLTRLRQVNRCRAVQWLRRNAGRLQRRLADEKSAVRRAAVMLVVATTTEMATTDAGLMTTAANPWILALEQRLADAASSVRLAAVQAFYALLRVGGAVQRAAMRVWMRSGLRLVHDAEAPVAQAVAGQVQSLLIKPLARGVDAADEEKMVSALLRLAAQPHQPCRLSLSIALEKVATAIPDEHTLIAAVETLCQLAVQSEPHPGAWALLAALTRSSTAARRAAAAQLLLRPHRQLFSEMAAARSLSAAQLQVWTQVAFDAGAETAAQLHQEALEWLFRLRAPLELVPSLLRCAVATSRPETSSRWPRDLLRACEEVLQQAAAAEGIVGIEPQCALATIGPLCLYHRQQPSTTLVTSIEALLAPSSATETATSLRAQAMACLGQLMVAGDAAFAALRLPLLLTELETSASAAVRNNAVLVLADVARVHTSLVQQHAVRIAARIRDDSVLVRYQTVAALAGLLQEEYWKVKKDGMLFLFLAAAVDAEPSAEVRALARHCLQHVLLPRLSSAMALDTLLEALFYFNDCHSHRYLNQQAGAFQSEQQRARFTLRGEARAPQRQQVYALWLQLVVGAADERRLLLAERLCADVLATYLDGEWRAPTTAAEREALHGVLADALRLLQSAALRVPAAVGEGHGSAQALWWTREEAMEVEAAGGVSSQNTAHAADVAVHVGGGEEVALQAIRGRLLQQLARKALTDTVLPCLQEMRRRLETERSPLLSLVVGALRERLRAYRSELPVLLREDVQFANELAHDFREEEREQREACRRGRCQEPRRYANRPLSMPAQTVPPGADEEMRSPRTPAMQVVVASAPSGHNAVHTADRPCNTDPDAATTTTTTTRRQSWLWVTPAIDRRGRPALSDNRLSISVPQTRPAPPTPHTGGDKENMIHTSGALQRALPPSTSPVNQALLEREDARNVPWEASPDASTYRQRLRPT